MTVHKMHAVVSEDHRLSVELPSDFPPGDVEVIVLTSSAFLNSAKQTSFRVWFDDILERIPPTPVLSVEALRRENMYEDD